MNARSSECRIPSPTAGFTLIELLVGMALLAAVALLVLPETRRAASGRALDAAASDLVAVARMTRAAAVRTGSEHMLAIDLDARRYWADGVTGPRALPARFSVAVTMPEYVQAEGPPHRIRFLPGGGSSGARVVLEDGARSATVEIDWLTGGARVAR